MEIKTFAEFIKHYNIEIPIIQRDYVYGREKSRETGKALVKAMIYSIQNCKVLDLNFIYGIETKSENEKAYYFPIDGQQRLTTLFLLYWYISIKSGHKEEFFQLNPDFSYKTRSSAREFFLWISDSNNTELFDLIEEGKKKIDEGMRDMSGFKASWNYDNTVQSCIYILSEIDNLLKRDNKLEEYYAQASGHKFKNQVTMEQMVTLFRYIIKGITAENMAMDTMQPEIMYNQICEYIEMMRGVY